MISEKNPFTTAVSMPKRVHLAQWSPPLNFFDQAKNNILSIFHIIGFIEGACGLD